MVALERRRLDMAGDLLVCGLVGEAADAALTTGFASPLGVAAAAAAAGCV